MLYSLLWMRIDLDERRMQPWIELSRPHGANAEKPFLLSYPSEFLAFVPIEMMLIFWAITPLQASILGKQAVTVSRSFAMSWLLFLLRNRRHCLMLGFWMQLTAQAQLGMNKICPSIRQLTTRPKLLA